MALYALSSHAVTAARKHVDNGRVRSTGDVAPSPRGAVASALPQLVLSALIARRDWTGPRSSDVSCQLSTAAGGAFRGTGHRLTEARQVSMTSEVVAG